MYTSRRTSGTTNVAVATHRSVAVEATERDISESTRSGAPVELEHGEPADPPRAAAAGRDPRRRAWSRSTPAGAHDRSRWMAVRSRLAIDGADLEPRSARLALRVRRARPPPSPDQITNTRRIGFTPSWPTSSLRPAPRIVQAGLPTVSEGAVYGVRMGEVIRLDDHREARRPSVARHPTRPRRPAARPPGPRPGRPAHAHARARARLDRPRRGERARRRGGRSCRAARRAARAPRGVRHLSSRLTGPRLRRA